MRKPLKVLIVATSHDRLGETGEKTGFYWEELAAPYWVFVDAGCEVEIASMAGGEPAADPKSVSREGQRVAAVERFTADPAAMAKLAGAKAVAAVDPVGFDAVFLAGGHGAMWDMPDHPALGRLIGAIHGQNGVVAAVCHGPAGLVGPKAPDGSPLVAGKRVAGFTDEEERMVGLTQVVPFLLESRMRELGAFPEPGPAFQPKAVRDGRLVTGQNPMSSDAAAGLVLEALRDTVGR